MDLKKVTLEGVAELLRTSTQIQVKRQFLDMGTNCCLFLERGSVWIHWDGAASPCLPLLHTHQNYLDENLRKSHVYVVGNIRDHSLVNLWNDPNYKLLRERNKLLISYYVQYSATPVKWLNPTWKIVLAVPSQPAGDVCGRRDFSSARKQIDNKIEPAIHNSRL